MYTDNSFLTLTYTDEKLPAISDSSQTCSNLPGTLVPKHLQDFLKRLRKLHDPLKLRFYAVGEYGDNTQRPHYHAGLFNFPTCTRGQTKRLYGQFGPADWRNCCHVCRLVGTTWGHGDVMLGGLGPDSAQYLAQYVTKKMTSPDDSRLYGRHPEFARMSLRPGLGASYLHDVASVLLDPDLPAQGDVPSSLRMGKKLMPLGRYLRRKLRTYVGNPQEAPRSALIEHALRMRSMQETAWKINLTVPQYSKIQAEKKVSTHDIRTKRRKL